MPAAPSTPLLDDISRPAAKFAVLLGDDQGNWPTAADEVDYLIPLAYSHSSGGSRLDTISFRWDLARTGNRLVDTTTPVGNNRLIELHRVMDDGSLKKLAWGKMAEQTHAIDGRSELVNVVARLDWYLIGKYRLQSHKVRLPDDSVEIVAGAPVINPVVRGQQRGNLHPVQIDGEWVFQPWDSGETDPAKTLHADKPVRWALAHVIEMLCTLLNPDEDYVLNPVPADIRATLQVSGISDLELLRDVKLEIGQTLPDLLDDLLSTWGFNWYLKHDDAPGAKSRITVYKRNDGVVAQLYTQRPGETLNVTDTNLSTFRATYSIAGAVNRVDAISSRYRVESTFLLIPGWDSADDSQIDAADTNNAAGQQNSIIGRKWVLNENGDYTGLRDTIDEATDLSVLLADPIDDAEPIVARRKFLPCLSLSGRPESKDHEPEGAKGYVLEWLENPGSSPARWQRVDWPFDVLESECGIMLSGRVDPALEQQVVDEGLVTGRDPVWQLLRITCSIEGDTVLHGLAERRSTVSPNALDVETVLEMSDRYHHRRVLSSSELYDDHHANISGITASSGASAPNTFQIPGDKTDLIKKGDRIVILNSTGNDGTYTVAEDSTLSSGNTMIEVEEPIDSSTADGTLCWLTLEADDSRILLKLAESFRDENDHADVSLSATLDGIDHPEYPIGTLLDKVEGRNLTLEAQGVAGVIPSAGSKRRLQVIGHNVQLDGEQRMELLLESYRLEKSTLERRVTG